MNKNPKHKTKFFKYMSIDAALCIIKDSTLKFTTPDKFNDPFDTYPYFPREGYEKMVERIRKENGFNDPRFTLKQREQMFTVTNTLNFRKETSKHSAATCFSKSATILPMWAHYANNHKGCVIEFELKHEDAKAVAIKMYTHPFYRDTEFLVPHDVIYSDARPPAYDKSGSTQNMSLKAIFTKSTQWSYEQEMRCVKNDVSGIYPFPRHQLKRVILGLKTSDEDKKKIRALVKDTMAQHKIFIDVKQIGMERETFKLFIN